MRQFILPAIALSSVVAASLAGHGSILTIGNAAFYASPLSITTIAQDPKLLSNASSVGDLIPVTVLEGINSTNTIAEAVSSYLANDDVFNEEFLQGLSSPFSSMVSVFHQYVTSTLTIPVVIYLKTSVSGAPCASLIPADVAKTSTTIVLDEKDAGLNIPPGPYLLSKSRGTLHIPYKLYPDTQGSFVQGVTPDGQGAFSILPVSLPGASSITIGVPSRLYYKVTPEKPLAGVRIGVKDLYNLKGVKTGAGSRAYYEIYPEANATAPAVQRLIDAGAVVVGKMKTTQFAMPEFAPLAIDYQAPFNPRGDGYQDPGSSSSGPGSGVASYDWLDIALGSDTGGSIRVPGGLNGLYGNRPTYGLVELTGAVPLAPQFDTAGLLARDPAIWRATAKQLYSGYATNYTVYPKRVQTFGLPNSTAPDLTQADTEVLAFTDKLVAFLSANLTSFDYSERWNKSRPANTDADLESYIGYTWVGISTKEQVELVRKPLFADYAARYNGSEPYVNPVADEYWNWGIADNETIDDLVSRKTTFMNWWNSEVLYQDSESCSDSLVIYIGAKGLGTFGVPTYRYTQSGNLPVLSGMAGGLFVSPFSGVPDITVPIGEIPYLSNVTKKVEYLPVSVDIMAAKGCDIMLLDLVNDLVAAGLLSVLQIGSSIYGGLTYL